MASTINFLCLILFLALIGKGRCLRCPDNDISVNQEETGKIVQGKPEWKLTLTTGCFCQQINVTLACNGFESVENPDAAIFLKKGDACFILPPVTLLNPVSFTYVADSDFDFYLLSSTAKC